MIADRTSLADPEQVARRERFLAWLDAEVVSRYQEGGRCIDNGDAEGAERAMNGVKRLLAHAAVVRRDLEVARRRVLAPVPVPIVMVDRRELDRWPTLVDELAFIAELAGLWARVAIEMARAVRRWLRGRAR